MAGRKDRNARGPSGRVWLLAGVSLAALAVAGTPARAGNPPLFSPQWFALRAQTGRTAAGSAGSNAGTAAAVAAGTTANAQLQVAQSIADLGKMAAAIRQAAAVQSAALAAAGTGQPKIPNGLGAGGLLPAPSATPGSTLWIGANAPVQTTSTSAGGSKTQVTVTQTQSQALLTWQSFNIGAATSLTFDQVTNGGSNAANWVVLNVVRDPSLKPSQILGSLGAAGKVFVIDPNGIMFGAGSQVNVNALIASSATLTSSITPPVGNTPASVDFTIYGAQSGSSFAPSFSGSASNGAIDVAAGSVIATTPPANATTGGGYVMLLGGNVLNAGMISTPNGQTVLASGQSFVLRPGYSTSGNQTATVVGSQVASLGDTGITENDGVVNSTDGDITMVGHSITQAGIAIATTSVNERGTVHLLTDTNDSTAVITLAPGSITAVNPDSSSVTALDSQRSQLIAQSASLNVLRLNAPSATNPQLNDVGTLSDRLDLSRIEITTGGSVEFQPGSLTMTQGGQIAVQAGGRVQTDSNAVLDVSGQLNVVLPMSMNELVINIQSYEQRDAPVNRDAGSLDNSNVTIDTNDLVMIPASSLDPNVRYYTPGGLLEVSGYLNTTGHTIGEWTAVGGTITIAANEVVAQPASMFNISGGSLAYQGGMVTNSYLLGADGNLYNVNTAPANIVYTGVYSGFVADHSRWNLTDVYASPLVAPTESYEAGYVVGRDAGSLTLSTPTAIFEGTIAASVVNGPYQTQSRPAGTTDGYSLAQNVVAMPGTFTFADQSPVGSAAPFTTDVAFEVAVPALADQLALTTAIPTSRIGTAWFSVPDLNAAGVGGLSVASAGDIRVQGGITLATGGTASLAAPTVDIAGGISARSGAIAVSNIVTLGGFTTPTVLGDGAKALLVLAGGATLDARGVWTNARLDPTDVAGEAYPNGGSVTLDSTATLTLAAGSLIDVSAGAALLPNGTALSGKGGSVALIGDDPTYGNAAAAVTLAGTVQGFGVSGSGTLKLVAPALAIGNTAQIVPGTTVSLGAGFFDQGFGTYDLTGLGGVAIAPDTVIVAAAPAYEIVDASSSAPTGSDPASAMQFWLPPLFFQDPTTATLTQRQGVSLLLRADANVGSTGARGGPVTLGQGATIAVDPGQTVRLEGYDQITVDGTISAPGGTISIVNTRQENYLNDLPPSYYAGLSVLLGPDSKLDVAGRAYTALDGDGRLYGTVFAGGSVTLGADSGVLSDGTQLSTDAVVIVSPGAVVDASGTSALIDPAAGTSGTLGESLIGGGRPVLDASSGGTISLSSYDGMYIEGTLLATSGGAGAAGGTLSLMLEAPLYPATAAPLPTPEERTPRRIVVTQDTTSDLGAGALLPGAIVPASVFDQARISVSQIDAGGFGSVSLFARDLIEFSGNVALAVPVSVTLAEGIIAQVGNASSVSITAPYVSISGYTSVNSAEGVLGGISVTGASWKPSTQATDTTLAIAADLIDVSNQVRFGVDGTIATGGTTTLGAPVTVTVDAAGFSDITLNSAGDIRFGTASVVTPGNLTLQSAQVYPTTQASAQVFAGVDYYGKTGSNAYAPGHTLTIAWNGNAADLPYSVGGSLTLAAPTLIQGGIVRAPEGQITLGAVDTTPANAPSNDSTFTTTVKLLPGSVTSVGLEGQTLLFGGTTDDRTYIYASTAVSPLTPAIAIDAQSVTSDSGATIDISGGGVLAGAAFQTGKGGSVDTLQSPLLNIALYGAAQPTLATHQVYAIVPNSTSDYAPISPADSSTSYNGSVPTIGQRITLTANAGGLPAGTYTLLPAYYALLPGAYRVEVNSTSRSVLQGATAEPDGSYVVGVTEGIANTGVQSPIAVSATISSGSVVRTYSQYDEENYTTFQFDAAALAGTPRAPIPADAKSLLLIYPATSGATPALSYDGVSDFAAGDGGYGSTVSVEGSDLAATQPQFQITAPGAGETKGYVSIGATDLDALGASRLVIGGSAIVASVGGTPTLTFRGDAASVTIRDGASLTVPELFLLAASLGGASGAVTVEQGATIDTVGAGAPPFDSTNGYYYNSTGYTVVAASNGQLTFTPDTSASPLFGPINIANGATLDAGGTLAFSTTQGLSLGANATFGAKYISLDVAEVDIVSTTVEHKLDQQQKQAASGQPITGPSIALPAGLVLSQTVLQRLLNGDPASGVPGATELTLTADQSVNLFGSVHLSTATGGLQQFVLNTPAIYGWSDSSIGGTGNVASINAGTGTLVWNGVETTGSLGSATAIVSQTPGGFPNTGLASGTGTLEITAQQIVLGYPAGSRVDDQTVLARVIEGYAAVDLIGTQQIIANSQGSVAIYAQPGTVFGAAGTGGRLVLNTPVLTGAAGAVLGITAGGAVTLLGGLGTSETGAIGTGLGAEIDITAASAGLNSTVLLPAGKFTVTVGGSIALGPAATLDLAGAATGLFDQTADSPGGTVTLESSTSGIAQYAGSTIDIGAGQASAGSLTITALSGAVVLQGIVLGSTASGEAAGSIDVRAGTLADWLGVNQMLTQGGVTGARTFEIATGNLTVGDELVANSVSLSLDRGSLTVTGTIDASGATPGTIDLAAKQGLTLAAGAMLDAHATVLHTDSYGVPIDAENAPQVTLTSIGGTLSLASGVAIDVASADGIARGTIELNAPRVGTNDIAISAFGSLAISGVWTGSSDPSGSLTVYGWQKYALGTPTASSAILTQANLDRIDADDTQPFMAAAAANTGLQAQLAGLTAAARGAFQLRPGVEIDSAAKSGDMAIEGDINLADYRYGTNATQPGALVLRAAGNLTINGSVTDGFATPENNAAQPNPDGKGWILLSGNEPYSADIVLPEQMPKPIVLGSGTTFPTANAVALNYPITIALATLNANVVIPAAVTLAGAGATGINPYVIPAGGWVAIAAISNATGQTVYNAGEVIPAGTVLQKGWTLAAGTVLPFQVNVKNGTVWPAGASLQVFNDSSISLLRNVTLTGGAFIPSGTFISFADGSSDESLRKLADKQQGQIWAIAPMLPPGSLSWSIGLVAGANTQAADRFAVQPASALNGSGNMVLSDLHYSSPQLVNQGETPNYAFSVIRTGTGNLTLQAGGNITEYSLYGIYTAGSQGASISASDELPQAGFGDGTVLGAMLPNGGRNSYNDYVTDYQAYYPTGGGNVLIAAQGGVYGDTYGSTTSTSPATDWVGNWLWRQGSGSTLGNGNDQPTAWWINFGDYVIPLGNDGAQLNSQPALVGFIGIGTLGGGNLTVIAGGDAGDTTGRDPNQRSQALVLAVASTGRVTSVNTAGDAVTGGTLVETGGGDLTVQVGGALNGLEEQVAYDGLNGTFTDLRGHINVSAGAVGSIIYTYGTSDPADPRAADPLVATVANEEGGVIVVPGDATVAIDTMRDLVLGGAGDAGRLPMQNEPGFTVTNSDGSTTTAASGGIASFSLWTPNTAISLFSAGGNLTPTSQPLFGSLASAVSNDMQTDDRFLFPGTLQAMAPSGSIYYGTIQPQGSSMAYSLELAPAPLGQLELLAEGSVYASGYSVDISGANDDANSLGNPFKPLYTASAFITATGANISASDAYAGAATPYALFGFGADTPTADLHADDPQPARIYAVTGDIVDLGFGEVLSFDASSGITPSTWYLAAKPAWIMAGRDIVAAGTRPQLDPSAVGNTVFSEFPNQNISANPAATTSGDLILNAGSNDVSLVSAGRDILQSYFYIAGPGLLAVQAGRNLDQLNEGILKSIGPVFGINSTSRDTGAGISVLVGTGLAGPDLTSFAELYFNPANLANPDDSLTAPQNQSKVAETYQDQLLAWLQQTQGYTGDAAGALAYFLALPTQQQAVFVRQVFFQELVASGREETDPSSPRYHSYARGKDAIAALFPAQNASGGTIAYNGSITMYSGTLDNADGVAIANSAGQAAVFDAGISTQFGGDIQVLTPGGDVLLGISGGVQPGSNTGLITFGSGNIQVYSLGSVLLGQSRIFTTFGGAIQIWSAEGDINAGIGTKTSVVYQPPLISYDDLGGLTLAPTAPTNGAGIATLISVPGVAAGDVDLAAPQGTIDAGEAGIRVSGNLTLAALVVANAANLQVSGGTVGAPTLAVSNVGALNAATAAAGASQAAATGGADEQRRKRELAEASVINVEVLGFGE